MSTVGPQAGLHAGSRLAVAVGDEVVGVAPGHRVVALEVAVRHHVMVVALEQRHLCQACCEVSGETASGHHESIAQ